jgi:phage terminase small subunit
MYIRKMGWFCAHFSLFCEEGAVCMAKLTPRQRRFIEEYLIDLNGTGAAIRAGYSPNAAKEIASENLTKPNIAAAVDRAIAERSRRTGITADRVLMELAKVGFVNALDVINFDTATAREGSARDDTAAIQSVKVKITPTDDGNIVEREVRLNDKLKALELIGRHLGIFNDKMALTHSLPPIFHGENELE